MNPPVSVRRPWALPARMLRRFRFPMAGSGSRFRARRAAFLALFVKTRQAQKPFFEALHDLLDKHPRVTLGLVLECTGEQTYGLLVLLLGLPSLIPGLNIGAAPLGGLGILALGLQMAVGVPSPWVPARVRGQELHRGRIKDALARLEETLDRFRLRASSRRPLNHGWMGLLIAWTGLLLAIPVPIPFGNILPAAVLVLQGAALLEERPIWGWLGALGSIGITVYFGVSFHLIVRECARVFHAFVVWGG